MDNAHNVQISKDLRMMDLNVAQTLAQKLRHFKEMDLACTLSKSVQTAKLENLMEIVKTAQITQDLHTIKTSVFQLLVLQTRRNSEMAHANTVRHSPKLQLMA